MDRQTEERQTKGQINNGPVKMDKKEKNGWTLKLDLDK